MEDVNIPSDNVPAELKACEQILKRAKELKKAEPVVAYWCMLPHSFDVKADRYVVSPQLKKQSKLRTGQQKEQGS
jgi:hypothetical protein